MEEQNNELSNQPDSIICHDSFSKLNFHHTIPLLAKDVLRLKIDETAKKFCAYGVGFKRVFLYGQVTEKKIGNNCLRYTLDDGTQTISVTLFNDRGPNKGAQLFNELNATHRSYDIRTLNCLKRIVQKIMQQTDQKDVNIGSNVLIYGKPNIYEKEINITAYSMFEDSEVNRDFELAYKDMLIEWYFCKYKNHNLNETPSKQAVI